MLQEFLNRNRDTLIARCRSRVAARRAPPPTEEELWYGIPLFLDQLITTLRLEQASASISSSSNIGGTAAQHGNNLFRRGFTVGEVVHDYGDLCQVITEVATEQSATISAPEFRMLNRCLDHAIAGAVTEFGRQSHAFTSDEYSSAATADRILIGVEDECGGLPEGRAEEISPCAISLARAVCSRSTFRGLLWRSREGTAARSGASARTAAMSQ